MSIVLNDLFDYGLKIYQDESKFKFSLDSLLLSEYIEIKQSDKKLLDLCTGNCPLPLILASKNNIEINGIEIQKEIFELGEKSVKYNHLENKIKLHNMNAKDAINYFPGNSFDIITCNPPFFKKDSSLLNENMEKAIARHEITITFEEIVQIVEALLKDNGKFYFVHRPERLEELIVLCHKNHLTIKEIVTITSKDFDGVTMILVKCVKNAKLGMKMKIKLIDRDTKTYQNILK